MEIKFNVTDEEIWDDDSKAELIKGIYRQFPNALWERQSKGYKVLI